MYLCFYKYPTIFRCGYQLEVLIRMNEQGNCKVGLLLVKEIFLVISFEFLNKNDAPTILIFLLEKINQRQ